MNSAIDGKHIVATRLIIFLCLFLVIVRGCYAQTDNGISYLFQTESSEAVFRQVKTHATALPDLLNDGQWMSSDDASSHAHFNDRRAVFIHKADALLLMQHQLPVGLSALFARLCAGLFHDSTCQTRGLMRTISYIQAHDGVKWHFSSLNIA